jgi:hypothetical protein
MTTISIALRRPLVDVYCCVAALGCSEDAVLQLIDEGKLRWAWNIARAGSGRRCVRVFAGSLAAYQAGRTEAENCDKVLAAILPGHSPLIQSAVLARALLCARHHVATLLTDGELDGKGARGMGPNSSPEIMRASAVRFLKRRVLS